MQLQIEIPEDVSASLREQWTDLPRKALESLAIEGYKARLLSESQLRRMLGFATRMEVHAFLKEAGVWLDYTEEDLAEDLESHRQIGLLPRR